MRVLTPFFVILILSAGCKSYEDSFDRNINSTAMYVTNSAANTITEYALDPKTQKLTELGTSAAGTTPVFIAVNSAGTFAYVVNSGSNDVYVYKINKNTRRLTRTSTVATGTTPKMIALHPAGSYAYVINSGAGTISGYFIDATTGELSSVGTTGSATGATAIAAVSSYVVTADTNGNQMTAYIFNSSTGALSGATNQALSGSPNGVSVLGGSTPTAYASCAGGTVERTAFASFGSGATSATAGANTVHLGFSTDGSRAFASNYNAGTITQFTVASTALTATGSTTACTNPNQTVLNSSNTAFVVCKGENKIQIYSTTATSMTLVDSVATGSSPTSIAGY